MSVSFKAIFVWRFDQGTKLVELNNCVFFFSNSLKISTVAPTESDDISFVESMTHKKQKKMPKEKTTK